MKIWNIITSGDSVTLKIAADSPERFLNMCTYHGIRLYNLRRKKETISVKLSLEDYEKVQPILQKCSMTEEIIKKKGLSFWAQEIWEKRSLSVAVLLGSILLFWLSGRIWNIHIEGNYHNSTQSILSFLESERIVHGMGKEKLDCAQIVSLLRDEFPDITWVSVKIQGTRLIIQIREEIKEKKIREEAQMACDLVADKDGVIVEIVTRSGTQKVFPGDVVKKGDILISGEIEIKNDNQEVQRIKKVCADGDILLEQTLPFQDSFQRKDTKKVFEEKSYYSIGIWAGPFYLDTGYFPFICKKQEGAADEEIIQKPIYVTENYRLPLSIVFGKKTFWDQADITYTEEEVMQLASRRIQIFEKKLIEKGVQICKNNVTMKCNDKICKSEGSFIIRQKIGEKKMIE